MNCYNCQDLLTKENISEEHVINNSIGGRLKSKNLLCIKCNTDFGSTIDKELERQLSIVVDLLGIDRERPKDSVKVEMRTVDGKTKNVGKKMRPHDILSLQLPEGKKVTLTTDDPVKYEKLKKDKEAELQKKYNNIKYTEGIEEPTSEKFYFNNYLTDKIGMFATGGPDYFRAIAKIALNYYLYEKLDPYYIKDILLFIKGQPKNEVVFFYYPTHYKIHDLKADEISHIVHIKADNECKVLYAYIELMNMENFIVVFNRNYAGAEYHKTYCFDLDTRQIINKEITIRLSCSHFEDLGVISRSHEKNHAAKFQRITKLIEDRQLDSK